MKPIYLFFILLLCVSNGAAQEPCQLELKDAPALLNLKLGATPAEAQAAVGKDLKIKNKRDGEYTFFQNFIDKSPPRSLPNVRALYLRFFDGALYQIEVFYQDRGVQPTLENFINLQSARMRLPHSAWKTEFGVVKLNCAGFSLAADDVLNPRLELTDETIRAKVEAGREKKKN